MLLERSGKLRWWGPVMSPLAVGAGCGLLVAMGASPQAALLNAAALLVALVGLGIISLSKKAGWSRRAGDAAIFGAAILIPFAVVVGPQVNGMARWLSIGGVTIQPAPIIVPLIVIGTALRPSAITTVAAVVAAIGLAAQPDPQGAAMLLAGLVAALLPLRHRTAIDFVAPIVAGLGLAIAQARTVAIEPVNFVETVVQDALRQGMFTGVLAIGAISLMLMPGLVRWRHSAGIAFVALWSSATLMSLVGAYPVAVLGLGASGVLGFVLSAGLLSSGTRALYHE